jgi:hypothetical protein
VPAALNDGRDQVVEHDVDKLDGIRAQDLLFELSCIGI